MFICLCFAWYIIFNHVRGNALWYFKESKGISERHAQSLYTTFQSLAGHSEINVRDPGKIQFSQKEVVIQKWTEINDVHLSLAQTDFLSVPEIYTVLRSASPENSCQVPALHFRPRFAQLHVASSSSDWPARMHRSWYPYSGTLLANTTSAHRKLTRLKARPTRGGSNSRDRVHTLPLLRVTQECNNVNHVLLNAQNSIIGTWSLIANTDENNACFGNAFTHFGAKLKRNHIVFSLMFKIDP